MQREAPSGRQFNLSFGEQSATVVEVGGALRAYQCDKREVVEGYAAHEWCTGARGQTLIPWPNRIQDGRYEFEGKSFQLPLTEPSAHNAIHGLVRWANWTLLEEEPQRVALTYVLHPVPGYRFTLQIRMDYSLSNEGLKVETRATNLGEKPCPYGAGAHPYLKAGTATLDESSLEVPAATWFPKNTRGIPTGKQTVEGSPHDFRRARPLRAVALDFTFTDLERDSEGRAWVELASLDGRHAVSLWLDERYPYVELFTGDTLKDAGRRRRGLGVEPMTCPPNAFQTGEGLITLKPGETVDSAWGVRPSRRPR